MTNKMLYGIRADNNELALCHWCKEPVKPGQITAEANIFGFWGHAYCWRLRQKGLSKQEIKQRYLKRQSKSKD